jgi:hypothetical protein
MRPELETVVSRGIEYVVFYLHSIHLRMWYPSKERTSPVNITICGTKNCNSEELQSTGSITEALSKQVHVWLVFWELPDTQMQTARLLVLLSVPGPVAGPRVCSAHYTEDVWASGVVSPWEHKNELLGFHKGADFLTDCTAISFLSG